ncbi:MAG: fused MFS/spermidine synthase [Candidatus Hydrogenedentes bacterium]|nr:fused MFS/spermidine synthase [Candidatus Hydrogenedentota bacterium]
MQHQTSPTRFSIVAVNVLVFVSGAAVMIYEFIAVRFLQRFFGSSLDVWAGEISVCLLGLAAGYALGGWLADKFRSWLPLGIVLCIAGGSALFMEPIVVFAAESLEKGEHMRWWEPLAASAAATLVPLLALGTVMPQAIRLLVVNMATLGAGTGRVAALSTIGSICGTLATSSLFVQWGVQNSLYTTCAILLAGGLLIIVSQMATTKRLKRSTGAILLPLLAGAAVAQDTTVYEDYSAYHHILVKDEAGKRILYFDSSPQTTMDVKNPFSGGFEYTDYFHVPMLLDPTIKSVLFVGLGGGTGPKSFLNSYPAMRIDIVEIDPAVVTVARKYFQLPDDKRMRAVTTDGRTYIQRTQQKYGAIMMDAYASGRNGAYLPYHLATKEFFEASAECIENGGCLVYNVMGIYGGANDSTVRGILRTLETVFQTVYVFEAESSWNTVFVAQKIDYAKLAPNGTRDGKGWPEGPWLTHPTDLTGLAEKSVAQGHFLPPKFAERLTQVSRAQSALRDGMVFTDDNAPVDIAQ